MGNRENSVDVEAIMQDIREKIALHAENREELSFSEEQADQMIDATVLSQEKYLDSTLHHFVVSSDRTHSIPLNQLNPTGGIKSLVKRVVRKIIRQLGNEQNLFNENVVNALYQMEAFALEKQEIIEKQAEVIRQLEKEVQTLEQKFEEQS